MTLIAFATYGKRAELITDSTSYTARASELGRCTKHAVITHLDAAVLTQGDSTFAEHAKSIVSQVSGMVATFDELVREVPPHLTAAHQTITAGPDRTTEATVALVGYSPEVERFAGYMLASEDGFTPHEVRGLWMLPTPWTNRPSDLEATRVAGWMHDNPATPDAIKTWRSRPRRDKPASIQEWHDLAVDSRVQRALSGPYARVLVAGDVTHTRLEVGSVTSQRILTFHDEGRELLDMVQGTQHPLALAAECGCGSGKTSGDCCSGPCDCGCGGFVWQCSPEPAVPSRS